MAVHKGPASLRPRCTRSGSSVAAIPVYQSTIIDIHLTTKVRLSAALSLLPPVCLQGVRRESPFFNFSYSASKFSSDTRRVTSTFCFHDKARRIWSRYVDTVNHCPTSQIRSSKTARSANPHTTRIRGKCVHLVGLAHVCPPYFFKPLKPNNL
jgi:hypothetical protein